MSNTTVGYTEQPPENKFENLSPVNKVKAVLAVADRPLSIKEIINYTHLTLESITSAQLQEIVDILSDQVDISTEALNPKTFGRQDVSLLPPKSIDPEAILAQMNNTEQEEYSTVLDLARQIAEKIGNLELAEMLASKKYSLANSANRESLLQEVGLTHEEAFKSSIGASKRNFLDELEGLI